MSGHSKFSNIKHKKEKADAQKGKAFTKLGRELAVAIKEGGPDPNVNGKLRDVIAKCKSNNMPNETIQRSIKKAAGEDSSIVYEAITYEGYGPGGIAVIVEALTDNKNRTAANVRHAFSKNGGNMGTTGCVSYMFDKKGQIFVEKSDAIDEDELMMQVLDFGAEDFNPEDDEAFEILTTVEDFSAVREQMEEAGIPIMSAEISMIPQNTAEVDDATAEQFEKMLDALDEDDDVQNVWHNLA
ncbi:MAG: YebC/PmpR family DNA-binding transcriptional regulator [Clostridiales bacterium]|nr:YebC/PmpR family DNA-binding transcriptional regulator [Clostridiales bacterium]